MLKIKSRRLKGVHVVKPFIYGNITFFQGKDAPEASKFRWTVYVRGPNHEDQSTYIKSVQFQLHSSFPDPVRTVDKPPFEVTEVGWGEFRVAIKILFHDARADPVQLEHHLRLYHPDGKELVVGEPVVSERYDEFLFINPLESFNRQLEQKETILANPLSAHCEFREVEQEEQQRLRAAHQKIAERTQKLQRKLADAQYYVDWYRARLRR